MQTADNQNHKQLNLPRVNNQFIGIGHQLQKHKRQRKKIEEQERAIANRVIHLEKQKMKANKKIQKQKKKLNQIISIKERQQYQSQEKRRINQLRKLQLDQLKKHNQMMKSIHRANLESHKQQIKSRNFSDYSRIRQARLDGQYKKKIEKNNEYVDKRDNWISLNISKERGKMKVDKFYKQKNKEHLHLYQSKIQDQDRTKSQKLSHIRDLEAMEGKLREDLQHTTLRASKMVQLISKASRTLSPMDTRSIQAELYLNQGNKSSRKTMGITDRQSSAKQKSLQSSRNNSFLYKYKDQIQENIQMNDIDHSSKQQFKIIRKRKKNKHINRYKQYEAF